MPIGIRITRAILSDGQDVMRLGFSKFTEHVDSGQRLRRQPGGLERAFGGAASSAEVDVVFEDVTTAQYDWLAERALSATPLRLRTKGGFSAQVSIASVDRTLLPARHDTIAWNVPVKFFILSRD